MTQVEKQRVVQIVVIGGGNVFASWSEFLLDLLAHGFYINFSPKFLFQKRPPSWKSNLQTDLTTLDESGTSILPTSHVLPTIYEVTRLNVPRTYNARYAAWKREFEKAIPSMQDGVILVGHSLGGLFLIKYLSEEQFPKKICATLLVSAPYDKDGDRKMPFFTLGNSLELFEKQSPLIYMYHSKDDPVVFFSEFERLHAELRSAKVRIFEDRGHFSQEHFPELVADLEQASKNLPC